MRTLLLFLVVGPLNNLLVATLKLIRNNLLIFNNIPFRKLSFDTTCSTSLLVSNGGLEVFIVSASDKVIGRSVFVNRRPYDFDKVKHVTSLLGSNHKRNLLIDIGANIGTICIPAVKRELFQRAIAIEPEPFNHSLLVANISLNRLCDKIIPYNIALGKSNDEIVLCELASNNYGDHRIRINDNVHLYDDAPRDTIEVKSETFDKIVGDVDPNATLIWIDTQGFEGYVLSGASSALSNQVPLCLEFWPYGMIRSGCYSLLREALVSNGYRWLFNLGESARPISLSVQTLDDLYKRLGEKGNFTDLLVV